MRGSGDLWVVLGDWWAGGLRRSGQECEGEGRSPVFVVGGWRIRALVLEEGGEEGGNVG